MTILLGSEKEDLLIKGKEILSESNRVIESRSYSDCIKTIQETPVDIIVIEYDFLKNEQSGSGQSFERLKNIRPGARLVLMTSPNEIRETIGLIKQGVDDYLSHPVDPLEIKALSEKLWNQELKSQELKDLRDQFWGADSQEMTLTSSSKMQEVYSNVKDVAPTESSVLILGETGVGKGLLAKLIHSHSLRKKKAFIHVHCGAITDSLLESELFGHEKGAFTGAEKRKIGKFELADGGTIFLDEVSTLSPSAQIKLLQVLQDGMFQRVGGESDVKVDVRVISATNEDLAIKCDKGEFRRDLFYRLNVFPIEIPPLRDRVNDIEQIIEIILKRLNKVNLKNVEGIEANLLNSLKAYQWPGNIRELENVIERAFIIEKSNRLTEKSFPQEMIHKNRDKAFGNINLSVSLAEARNELVNNFEKNYIESLLSSTHGRIAEAARLADISERQLNNLMNKHHIYKDDFKKLKKSQLD